MATTGKQIETRGHIIGFKEEIKKAKESSDQEFLKFFNGGENIEQLFVKGAWDFSIHFAYPLAPYLSKPHNLTALEIGFGGGRITLAASRAFGQVLGVDIHEFSDFVKAELKARGANNVELYQTDGKTIPCADNTIDVAFSFIVLQHVEKYAIFEKYLHETYRVLKPGGIALLYFGRYHAFSLQKRSKKYFWIDLMIEKIILKRGYKELLARVNETNLIISRNKAKHSAQIAGFQVLGWVNSWKNVPDGFHYYGGQHGMILGKEI